MQLQLRVTLRCVSMQAVQKMLNKSTGATSILRLDTARINTGALMSAHDTTKAILQAETNQAAWTPAVRFSLSPHCGLLLL